MQLARVNQGLSLDEVRNKTGIALEFLEAMEADEFDRLPSSVYARTFLRKYSWSVDLDESILLDAYDEGSRVVYNEIDIASDEDFRSRKRRKQTSFLPLFYFSVLTLLILSFVTYYVWSYSQKQQATSSPSNYQVISESVAASSSPSQSSTEEPATPAPNSQLSVEGEVDILTVNLTEVSTPVNLTLSVTDATSWVSVTGTDLEGGQTLSPDNKVVTVSLEPDKSYFLTLGVVEGVEVNLDGHKVDTSKLTSLTGTMNITISKKEVVE